VVPMFGITGYLDPGKGLKRHFFIAAGVQGGIECIIGHADCVGPEIGGDGLRPAMLCMKEHGSGHLLEFADGMLGYAVLVMDIDTGKGEALIADLVTLFPSIGSKNFIVGMVVPDLYTMIYAAVLEGLLA